MSVAAEAYILHMRSLGFGFITQAGRLKAFSKAVGDVQMAEVDSGHVLSFLNIRTVCNDTWRGKRAALVCFFEHWEMRGECQTIAMPTQKPRMRQGFVPYIYSRDEIRSLLRAALNQSLNRNRTMHPRTIRTVLIFLYSSGARLKEALKLREDDIDFSSSTLSIDGLRSTRKRVIPLGRDLLEVFRLYISWKRRSGIQGTGLFIRMDGKGLVANTLYQNFGKLLVDANISRRDGAPERPRLYDLRSTFAVHRISAWVRTGADLGRLLPALSAYMGHKDLTGTERFMRLTPGRFQKELNKLSPNRGKAWVGDAALMRHVNAL